MGVTTREYPLPHTQQVILEAEKNTIEADIELFAVATDWLRAHPGFTLMEVGFHHAKDDYGNQLHLYVEPF